MKFLRLSLVVVAVVLLQTTQFDFFSIGGIKPNFILILVVYWGLFEGRAAGAIAGFGLGLLMDILSAGVLGLNTITKTFIGYTVSVSGEKLVITNPVTQMIFVFIATLADAWLAFFILRLTRFGGLQNHFLWGASLPEAVYNAICSWFLFWVMLRLSKER